MLIFETLYTNYPIWSLIVSLIFLILFVNTLFNKKYIARQRQYYKNKYSKNFLAIIYFGLFFGFLFMGEPLSYWTAYQAMKNNDYISIKGVIKNYIPKIKCSSHDIESFNVNGIKFKYSNHDSSNAYYHKTQCEHNMLMNNTKVKIHFIKIENHKNKIIQMWIYEN